MHNVEDLLVTIETLTTERDHWKKKFLGLENDRIQTILRSTFKLTCAETALVSTLYRKFPELVDRTSIEANFTWRRLYDEHDPKIVSIIIHRIRKKLSPDAIVTCKGTGYTLGKEFVERLKKELILLEHPFDSDQVRDTPILQN